MTGAEFFSQVIYTLEARLDEDRRHKRRMALALSDGIGCLLTQAVPDAEVLYRAWAGLRPKAEDKKEEPVVALRRAWDRAKAETHG